MKTLKDKSQGCCKGSGCQGQGNQSRKVEEVVQKTGMTNSSKIIFKIEGLCCPTEVESLKSILAPLIQDKNLTLSFDLINAKLIIEGEANILPSQDQIAQTVAKTSMKAILWTEHIKQPKKKTFWQRYGQILMNIISAVGFAIGFVLHVLEKGFEAAFNDDGSERGDYPPLPTLILYSISILAGSWFILPKAALALTRLKPNTKLLTVIATAGAIGINKWFEAAVSMYLFSAADLVEAWNMNRARKSIRTLMELAPTTAQVVNQDGTVFEQSVEKVPIGAIILVKPGEKIPMDAVLHSGFTSVNQAPITGESLPVQKEAGDVLFAGTINGDFAIECKVTRAASDSTLAAIIRKIEEAQSKRAKSDQWIENFSLYYVPLMILSSILVAILPPLVQGESWYSWIYKGLMVLVISCPCSLIISTPVSIVAGITAAAKSGVLIKGGIHLENAGYLKAFAMDKTGTITTGEPVVHHVIPFGEHTSDQVLKIALSLEAHSDHPLARAIQRKAKADDIIVSQLADQFQIIKGKGAQGYIQNKLYWIGSHRFLHEKLGDNEPLIIHERIKNFEASGHSIVVIGSDLQICGFITIADAVRSESQNAIHEIKKAGIQRVVMLTGDNSGAAKAVAEAVQIDEYYAELLPEDKVKQVQELVAKYKRVAMVGDGINDAPAMAASSLGIAMGTAGSDTAIETADIALMSDDLGKLAWLVNHSHRTLNIIKQNVVFSLIVKSVFVGLTFANKTSLWMAIVADMGTTFIVVSNALRLLVGFKKRATKVKTHQNKKNKENLHTPLLNQSKDDPEVCILIPE